MKGDNEVDLALAKICSPADPLTPNGFMDGVWLRAGQLEEVAAHRSRLALFAVIGLIGLGAGFEVTLAPAQAKPAQYHLIDGFDLSPASLLHGES